MQNRFFSEGHFFNFFTTLHKIKIEVSNVAFKLIFASWSSYLNKMFINCLYLFYPI